MSIFIYIAQNFCQGAGRGYVSNIVIALSLKHLNSNVGKEKM